MGKTRDVRLATELSEELEPVLNEENPSVIIADGHGDSITCVGPVGDLRNTFPV